MSNYKKKKKSNPIGILIALILALAGGGFELITGNISGTPNRETIPPETNHGGYVQEIENKNQEERESQTSENIKGESQTSEKNHTEKSKRYVFDLSDVPEYAGEPFVFLNDGIPTFTEEEIEFAENGSYEFYNPLDSLGRCGVCEASVGKDLMPTEKRGNISSVKPTAWQISKYDFVDGKYLYNRCHLIGYQLTAENANKKNLITGTRYLNVEGMLPFENLVADYIKETGNHVLYRVTPVFEENNLLATGVIMEGYSVEDRGEAISYNVFCYNVQPGVAIDYLDGSNYEL